MHLKNKLTVLILFTGSILFGQGVKLPPLVSTAFSTKYPTAQNVQWNNQGNEYKVAFNADGDRYEAKFNNNGDWKISQRDIQIDALPAAIKSNLSKSDFSQWNIKQAYILFLPGMITQYRVIIAKSDSKKSLLFSQDGKLLKDSFTL
ncbi:MAG: ribosome biosis protein [Bacteroidota bacterium]|nr:ribosome biosis protein [Bacteroidota bacterium]